MIIREQPDPLYKIMVFLKSLNSLEDIIIRIYTNTGNLNGLMTLQIKKTSASDCFTD